MDAITIIFSGIVLLCSVLLITIIIIDLIASYIEPRKYFLDDSEKYLWYYLARINRL